MREETKEFKRLAEVEELKKDHVKSNSTMSPGGTAPAGVRTPLTPPLAHVGKTNAKFKA